MTTLQTKMVIKIAESEYTQVNGRVPTNLGEIGSVWANVIIEDAEDKGVFTSLLKENFVWHDKCGRDSGCGLTEKGFKFYQTLQR